MDYILNKINQKIRIAELQKKVRDLNVYSQARMEYILILSMAYLWNKNINSIDENHRERIFNSILLPSIGSIAQIARNLDLDKEFSKSKLIKAINDYPEKRNVFIGHGYVFADDEENIYQVFNNIYQNVEDDNKSELIQGQWDYCYVYDICDKFVTGIIYDSTGTEEAFKTPLKSINCNAKIEKNNLYITPSFNDKTKINFYRVSPFIHIIPEEEAFYLYCKTIEKLTGKIQYNRLFQTGNTSIEWEEFEKLIIQSDGKKIKTQNGTIKNIYDNNYTKFIDVGIKDKIKKFLENGMSSVVGILWGHGGVGKTATIQSVCEDFINADKKKFDYILFLSAKDRFYDFYTGSLSNITNSIANYQDFLDSINELLFDSNLSRAVEIEEEFVNIDHNILLIIDDYESLIREDREKINSFIVRLNVNNHKVIITTRSANVKIGQEFQTNEFTPTETFDFLVKALLNERLVTQDTLRELKKDSNIKERIFEITSGRPIFILQLAYVIAGRGIEKALGNDIKSDAEAVNFLFGRVFDYLSPNAKNIFVVISLLVTNENLSNVIDKVKFILNMEFKNSAFESAVDELIKLKIIKTDEEKKIFEVYSKEILQIMSTYFSTYSEKQKNKWNQRSQHINNNGLDLDAALLQTADASRYTKSEQDVIEDYARVLNRLESNIDVKLQAIKNLANYLAHSLRRKEEALIQLNKWQHLFIDSNNLIQNLAFSKLHAQYAWENGKTEDKLLSIKILTDFLVNYQKRFSTRSVLLDDPNFLDLSGLLLQYSSRKIIDEFEEIKEARNDKNLSNDEIRKWRESVRKDCRELQNNFEQFYKAIQRKQIDLYVLKSDVRQNVVTGIYNFLDVLIRTSQFEFARNLSEFMRDNSPENFFAQFDRKFNYADSRIELIK